MNIGIIGKPVIGASSGKPSRVRADPTTVTCGITGSGIQAGKTRKTILVSQPLAPSPFITGMAQPLGGAGQFIARFMLATGQESPMSRLAKKPIF